MVRFRCCPEEKSSLTKGNVSSHFDRPDDRLRPPITKIGCLTTEVFLNLQDLAVPDAGRLLLTHSIALSTPTNENAVPYAVFCHADNVDIRCRYEVTDAAESLLVRCYGEFDYLVTADGQPT